MAVVTVGDLLERAADFERRLEAYYAALRDTAKDDGARLLVQYLARHRRHLPDALGSLAPEDLAAIRAVPLKYDDPDFAPERRFAGVSARSDIRGREVLEQAIALVEELLRFYRWVGSQPVGAQASSLFDTLRRIEERHVIELKKIRAMDYF